MSKGYGPLPCCAQRRRKWIERDRSGHTRCAPTSTIGWRFIGHARREVRLGGTSSQFGRELDHVLVAAVFSQALGYQCYVED